MPKNTLPDWERVLAAAAHLQRIFPDAVLVGGSASALYAQHRLSTDADHVLTDLRTRFDRALADLEAVAGWKTARITRPVQILGSLDGIETGVRHYLDFVALHDRMGDKETIKALRPFDRLVPQPNDESALLQLQIQLAQPLPYDLEELSLAEYKNLDPRWCDWQNVQDACIVCAMLIFDHIVGVE